MTGFGAGGIKLTPKQRKARSWGGFSTIGFEENPLETFTRNTANSWLPRIYSNIGYTGPVKVECQYISGNNCIIGLDEDPIGAVNSYNSSMAIYFAPAAASRYPGSGGGRVTIGVPLAGDIYGINKYFDGAQYNINWYRKRNGITTIFDIELNVGDNMLYVLVGAFENGNQLIIYNQSL